ncbi:MAG: ribonuclease III [Firmicutes bacterium]|nr:ribonuclease III [Bacillota bacterium]
MTAETRGMNTTALAYIGDAVYEVYVRKHVMERETVHVDKLHQRSIRFVKAESQARAVRRLMAEDFLSEEEASLVKRARNHRTASKPKNADPVDYKLATAFEALVGALYLDGEIGRMDEIIAQAMKITEERK